MNGTMTSAKSGIARSTDEKCMIVLKGVNMAKPWSEGDEKELFELVRKAYADANCGYLTEQIQQACRYCANNPQNGGNGFCNCTLGQAVIY